MTGPGLLLIRTEADLRDLLDRPLDCPRKLRLTQAQIDAYADIAEDHQWIHVDRERCAAESPFGTTIAHGFLTLSMLPWFLERTLAFEGGRMSLNYGLDRVRFIRAVRSESLLQGRATLVAVDEHDWGWQMAWDAAITEAPEGPDRSAPAGSPAGGRPAGASPIAAAPDPWARPALAARWLTRWYR
jgi:acyl dehydratase